MQTTRQEILDIIKHERQATVEDLARRLGLTPMTIRHHLNVLQAEKLVEAAKVRRLQTVGRPRLVYTLTEAAEALYPHGYGELARHLVGEVKQSMGPEEARVMLTRVAERIAREAPPPTPGQTFEERLESVSQFLAGYGFMFHWEKHREGYILANINCPYRRVSQEHAEICAMDAVLVERLLGVRPEVLSHMREGAGECTCLLRPPRQP